MTILKESGISNIGFESGAANSYLVFSLNDTIKPINYQIEMISQNNFSGILNFEYRVKNGIGSLHYYITSKTPISEYFKRQKLSKEDFVNILHNIVKVLLNSKENLLTENQFILNLDYIFINCSTKELFLVYLPIKTDTNVLLSLKDLFLKMITDSVYISETSNDGFLVKI